MSMLNLPGGAISRIYVGLYGATSVLTPVPTLRTKDITPTINTPTEYVPGLNIYAQSGDQKITFSIYFYTDSAIPFRLNRGLDPNESDLNATPNPNQKYTLLLINSDTTKMSYLFNEISTQLNLNTNYEKEQPTETTVVFTAEHPDLSYNIVKFGTPSALGLLLGSRSPL